MGVLERMAEWAFPALSRDGEMVQKSFDGPWYSVFGGAAGGDRPFYSWQQGVDAPSPSLAMDVSSAMYGCVAIISQEVARLPLRHYQTKPDGTREYLNSRTAAMLNDPNPYQTRVDFWSNTLRTVLTDGEAHAYVERDTVGRPRALWPRPPRSVTPHIDEETRTVFYQLNLQGGQELGPYVEDPIPAADVLHLRCFTPRHPLKGETPVRAALWSIATNAEIAKGGAVFFGNRARPSGILYSDEDVGDEELAAVRDAWQAGYSKEKLGKTAAMGHGFKWMSTEANASDSQLIEQARWGIEDVARCYRVPLFMLGDLTKTTMNNVEQLTRVFVAMTLGYWLEHLETALHKALSLPRNQGVDFDVESGLLRADLMTRVDAAVKAIQGGLWTPNEGRGRDGLGPKKGGNKLYIQKQNIPLEKAGEDPPSPAPPPVPPAEPDDQVDDDQVDDDQVDEKDLGHDPEVVRQLVADELRGAMGVLRMELAGELANVRTAIVAAARVGDDQGEGDS